MRKEVKIFLAGIFVLAFILLIYTFTQEKKMPLIQNECKTDSDCTKVQITCCPCNMGGQEKCVLKSEEETYLKNITEKCNSGEYRICPAVYSCNIKSCRCIEGECAG